MTAPRAATNLGTMPTSVELLRRLIGFNGTRASAPISSWSTSSATYLAGLGVESRVLPDATRTKANLWAVIGPREVPGSCSPGIPMWSR